MSDYINILPTGKKQQFAAANASTGAADADRLVKTDANGVIDQSLLPTGLGSQSKVLPVDGGVNIPAGSYVSITAAGEAIVANASVGVDQAPAVGFVLEATDADGNSEVFFEGVNTAVRGGPFTPGQTLYLADGEGAVATAVPPSGSGDLVQVVGKACDTTAAIFIEDDGVCLA